ncbi:MAG: hypothetical protein ACQGVC_06330 [Myxococcota bacterium]
MEGRDELLTIGEIAVGIAGFSGVIAAFLQRGGLDRIDALRFINLFATAFAALLLAFAPIAVALLGYEGAALWSRASGVMLFAWMLNSALANYVFRDLRSALGVESLWPAVLVTLPSFANLAAQLLNAGGWLWTPGFLAYLFGLLVYLYAAGLMFVYIVLFRPAEPG